MPRQPFLPTYKNAKYFFPADALGERPLVAQYVGQCIALWTQVEAQLALILGAIIKSNAEPALAVYLAIRNSRTQREVMNAAAETTLQGRELEVYSAIALVHKSLEDQRNDLAHGLFGVCDDIKDGVVWINPTTHSQEVVKSLPRIMRDEKFNDQTVRENLFVYKAKDINTLKDQIKELWEAAFHFGCYLRFPGLEVTDKQFEKLCGLPQIARELAQLRAAQNSTPQSH